MHMPVLCASTGCMYFVKTVLHLLTSFGVIEKIMSRQVTRMTESVLCSPKEIVEE